MHKENWDTRMDEQREDHPNPEGSPQRNRPKQLLTHDLPTEMWKILTA